MNIEKSYLLRSDAFFLAIGEDDRVLGCVGIRRIPDTTEAFLHRLYVKFDHKRQGIGIALLPQAEDAMRERGVTVSHVHLGEPKEQWFESYAFYPKHGYREYKPRYLKKEL